MGLEHFIRVKGIGCLCAAAVWIGWFGGSQVFPGPAWGAEETKQNATSDVADTKDADKEKQGEPAAPTEAPIPKPVTLAHIHLSGFVTERPQDDTFGFSLGSTSSLKTILRRLSRARNDDSVKAVVITFDNFITGVGQLEELHRELLKFRDTGKKVYVHSSGLDTWSYAMVSGAAELSMVPTGDVWLTGIYSEGFYLKGLLDKIGVEADMLHEGEYKSASELFTRSEPSEAAERNMNWLLDGLYDSLVEMIATGRNIPVEKVRDLIDDGPYTAERALEVGLIDSVKFRDAFVEDVKKTIDTEDTWIVVNNNYGHDVTTVNVNLSSPLGFFSLFSKMLNPKRKSRKASIAIVYVEGVIQMGYGGSDLFGMSSGAYSGEIRNALEKALADESIKAVVLRVDSPGGSAVASEIILDATRKLKGTKPLIVSMGNVAASGGYYVSCGGDRIYADATTLTGSIGVVGGKLITTGLWDKLGVNWVDYKRGRNADLLTTSRPFDDQQRARMEGLMYDIYRVFQDQVVEGRGEKLKKPIDELSGGRVYTGIQAEELGLVDEIGGLSEAIAFAANTLSMKDYQLRILPAPKNLFTEIMEELLGQSGNEKPWDISSKRTFPLQSKWDGSSSWLAILETLGKLDQSRVRLFVQGLQRILLIHQERVITMMPMDFTIR